MVARSTSALSIVRDLLRRRDVKKMRPVHRRIGRIGVDRVEPDLVFLDVGIVQRLVIMQMAGDLHPRRQSFGEEMLVAQILLVFLERAPVLM